MRKFVSVAILAVALQFSALSANAQGAPKSGEYVAVTVHVPKGWTRAGGGGLTSETAQNCTGRIVVDHQSPQCTRLPPRYPGGKAGLRWPNKCVPN